jgi:branched-chain amino acid transport system permease protein
MVGQLTPYIGAVLTAKSFVIAIIGSLDNPFKVVLGGCALGIAEAFGAVYFGSTYVNVISFGLLAHLIQAGCILN